MRLVSRNNFSGMKKVELQRGGPSGPPLTVMCSCPFVSGRSGPTAAIFVVKRAEATVKVRVQRAVDDSVEPRRQGRHRPRQCGGGGGAAGTGPVPGTAVSSSAWLIAAKPTADAVSAMTSRAPAMVRRRNPVGVVRAMVFVLSWTWLVFSNVFMALIVHPATGSQ